MSANDLPPCGLFRTSVAIGDVESGRLVYFHNHGNPGPGVYLPESWHLNRARFAEQGTPLPDPALATTLVPLPPEGFYRVTEPFTCCEKECRTYETDLLVQLGYDGAARPILFVPELTEHGFAIPELGQGLDEDRVAKLALLKVNRSPTTPSAS